MRAIVALALCFLIAFASPTSNPSESAIAYDMFTVSQDYVIERNWTIEIVLVNYNSDLINETILLGDLPNQRSFAGGDIIYNAGYEITYAEESYVQSLRQVLVDNSESGEGVGSWINETALEYQKNHPDKLQTIFEPRDGRVIDAYEVEDWLLDNPAVTPPDLGYTFYVFNFSEFDSPGHSHEHWYDYHPIDPDTGETQDWFRLEWDNELNPEVKLQYAGFGGRKGNIFVLDTSADQWYLRWARIWWGSPPYTDQPEYCTMDLEDKLATLDVSNPADVAALNEYLATYMEDPITYLMLPGQHSLAPYVESGLLRNLVFAMDVDKGVTVESLSWVTNAEVQKAHLEEFMPFFEWDVQVDILDIRNYPDWEDLFWDNAYVDENNTTIVDGSEMFYDIYNNMRYQYVDIFSPDVNVFGTVFIKQNMEMHVYGRTYTGLGGGGQTVIWKSWERYYRPDRVTPKDGISAVQLHETLHAVGVMHTWTDQDGGHYVGDFSYSPMGYFGFHNGTATFDRNWAQGTYLDQMEIDLWETYLDRIALFGSNERTETLTAQQEFLDAFDRARDFYNTMDWISCYVELSDARDWLKRMTFSRSDDTPPEIFKWGIIPENPIGTSFEVWANVRDDLAGIEKVFAYVQLEDDYIAVFPCEYDGGNWTTTIPILESYGDFEIWVKAWDWGMNSVDSDHIVITTTIVEPLNPLSVIIISSGIIGAVAVIVIIVKVRSRQGV